MRRRLVTVGVCCAALAATAPLPAAVAQDASSSAPGQVDRATSSGTPASTAAPGASAAAPGSTAAPGGAASTTTPPSTTAPATTAAPASSTAPAGVSGQTPGSSSDDSKTSVILLGLVGALLLFAAVLWGAARWWAWEPMWWIRWRHATAEAGWRTSAAWAEFRDWFRLGR
jgi:cobalamin biosynthesis Mg chelatase CobN